LVIIVCYILGKFLIGYRFECPGVVGHGSGGVSIEIGVGLIGEGELGIDRIGFLGKILGGVLGGLEPVGLCLGIYIILNKD